MKGHHNQFSGIVPHLDVCEKKLSLTLTLTPNTRSVHAFFQHEVVPCPNTSFYWSRHLDNINWDRVWALPQKHFIYYRINEVSYQMMHQCYTTNLLMKKKSSKLRISAGFHLFWYCEYTENLWRNIWGILFCDMIPDITYEI